MCAKHSGDCTYSEMRTSLMQSPGVMGSNVSTVLCAGERAGMVTGFRHLI